MKHILTIFLCLLLATATQAQNTQTNAQCPEYYEAYMKQAAAAFAKGDFTTAIDKYSSALAICPQEVAIVKPKMVEVFNKINQLKKDAEIAKQQAMTANERAAIADANLNEVFYVIGNKKDLEKKGIIDIKGSFKKVEGLSSQLSKENFTRSDARYLDTINLGYVKKKYVTIFPKRQGFILDEINKETILIISDKEEFWKIDKYLIVFDDGVILTTKKRRFDINSSYHFIDAEGKKIDKMREWENADRIKFYLHTILAKVIKNNEDYFLDTLGNSYKIAYSVFKITDSITALQLEGIESRFLPKAKNYQLIKILPLNDKNIKKLSKNIGSFKSLMIFSLSENQLTSLPKEIGDLKNLIWLNLSMNQLTSLPEEIGDLKNLTFLDLSSNELISLPKGIAKLKNLTTLDLHDNQLTNLPAQIGELKNLTTLDLYDNQLTNLPIQIGELKNLTTLNLERNQLTSLPAQIEELKNLTELDLYNNQLTSLPAKIGELKNLTKLDLNHNQLTSLPAQIGELKNLKELDLGYNPIPQKEQERIRQLLPNCKIQF
jgi:Leucine-rich repeat (LRR) protein